MSPNSLTVAIAGIIIGAVVTLFPQEIRCLIFGFCSEPSPPQPVVESPPEPPTPLPELVLPDPSVNRVNENSRATPVVRQLETSGPSSPPSSQEDILGITKPWPQPNRPSSPASEPAREGKDPETWVVGDKAWIVSPYANRLAIRVSCDSTSTRFVNVGQAVTVSEQCRRGDRFCIRDEGGNELGCIPREQLDPFGPANE
jgi:hypothetical protein